MFVRKIIVGMIKTKRTLLRQSFDIIIKQNESENITNELKRQEEEQFYIEKETKQEEYQDFVNNNVESENDK